MLLLLTSPTSLLHLPSRKEEETSTHNPVPECHPLPFLVQDLTIQAEGNATNFNSFSTLWHWILLRSKGNCPLLSSSFENITARGEEAEKVKMSPDCNINLHIWVWVSHLVQAKKPLVHRLSHASHCHDSLGCGWHLPGGKSIHTGLSNLCHQAGLHWKDGTMYRIRVS